MTTTDAWVLRKGPLGTRAEPGQLEFETVKLPERRHHEALVETLLGCWDANMTHATTRSPVDICRQRGEDSVVLGTSGIVRVLRPAAATPAPREGDICLLMPFGASDPHGYARLIFGYDAPGTCGLLARRSHIPARLLMPVPRDSRFPLPRWTPYLRYFTAWDNWKVAYGCWKAQMGDADPGEQLVFGWGGGVVLAELELARRDGFRTAMTAGHDERLDQIRAHGITPIDRREFAEEALHERVMALSDGRGAAIVLDNIGGPVHQLTLRILGRQGVLATCGWKAGMSITLARAGECQRRHIHVHTHAWRFDDAPAIRDYQERTGWLADIDPGAVYAYEDIPQLEGAYARDELATYFPLFQVEKP